MKHMPWAKSPMRIKPLSGGCINQVYLIRYRGDYAVEKTNQKAAKGFFIAEQEGLKFLEAFNLPVPSVYDADSKSLILEYLPESDANYAEAGRALATLHNHELKSFGFEKDNFIGTLIQRNEVASSWLTFWRTYRIEILLEQLGKPHEELWQDYLGKLSTYLGSEFIASPLHGDLWSGNLHFSNNRPYFIDPAVYRGDAIVDIAMTLLFGGFPEEFYAEYKNTKGELALDKVPHYQLYPLLVHALLFGDSYYQQALAIVKRFV